LLILTRRVGESLCIGSDIKITVMGIDGKKVLLGTEAPNDIPVHREEVFERIKKEREGGNK
jgi:carbon storage regulator